MPRFLVEVEHESQTIACSRAVRVFLESGSHFLTHADFGCLDGVHTAWIFVEAANAEEARAVVPPAFRSRARAVALNKWSLEQIDELVRQHQQ